jgi:hypothetical protein
MIALNVQTLDESSDCWKALGLVLLLKLKKMPSEISKRDVKKLLVGLKGRTCLIQHRENLWLGNHRARSAA